MRAILKAASVPKTSATYSRTQATPKKPKHSTPASAIRNSFYIVILANLSRHPREGEDLKALSS